MEYLSVIYLILTEGLPADTPWVAGAAVSRTKAIRVLGGIVINSNHVTKWGQKMS